MYKTIRERCEASFTEKKSEFIGYLAPVSDEEEATAFINEIRAAHRKATHNCYAYILRENNTARHSDDGEPSGTAGVPIYEVLKKEGLTDICCVVTRYFGGIMLGAGGLVRAYSRGASDAVQAARIKLMCEARKMTIHTDYSQYGRIAPLFTEFDTRVLSEEFLENVTVQLYVREEYAQSMSEKLTDVCNGKITVELSEKICYDFG